MNTNLKEEMDQPSIKEFILMGSHHTPNRSNIINSENSGSPLKRKKTDSRETPRDL